MELTSVKVAKWNKWVVNKWVFNCNDGQWIIGEQSSLSSYPHKFLVRWIDNRGLHNAWTAKEIFFNTFEEAKVFIEKKGNINES